MFAIIEIGGQQFKVEKGTKFEVGQLDEKEGSTIDINTVLLLNDEDKVSIGKPYVSGAFASAKVVEHKKDKKIVVFKMKAKKRYRKTQGHRQRLTKLEILDVKATGGKDPGKRIPNLIEVRPSPKSAIPVVKGPAQTAKKTATKKPAAKKAETKKPAAKKTATKKPAAKKTTTTKKTIKKEA